MTPLEQTRVYVGTYSKYNDGNLFGKWLTLSDYLDKDDYYDACEELHDDEEDPVFMFHDYEAPDYLKVFIIESGIDHDLWDVAEALEDIDDWSDSDWLSIQQECNPDNMIYSLMKSSSICSLAVQWMRQKQRHSVM